MVRTSCVICCLSALAVAVPAYAKELHVDQALGSDATSYDENGPSRPWRSLGRAVWGSADISTPNRAQAARAGDVVMVAPGIYDTSAATNSRYTPIYNPVNLGNSGNPIVISARQPGTVTLRATLSSGQQPIIGALNNSHIEWRGFVIDERDVPTRPDTGPVVVWNSHHVTLESLTIRGFNRGWVDNHNGIRLEHVQDIVVRDNLVIDFRDSQNNHNSNGLTIYDGERVLIENNEFVNMNAGIHVKCCSAGPVTIRYNLVRESGRALMFSGVQRATAYGNVVVNTGAGITLNEYDETNGIEQLTIANNTIVDATLSGDGGGVVMRYGMELYRDVQVVNNVYSRSRHCTVSYEAVPPPQFRSRYNLFHECSASFALIAGNQYTWTDWTQRFGQDSVGSRVGVDPGFRNRATGDFRPASGSALLGAGLDVLDLDQDGSTVDAVNIGAYAIGDESIGRRPAVIPSPPSNLRVD